MRVHIDTRQVQENLDNITIQARSIADNSEKLLDIVKSVGKNMQTKMFDVVHLETEHIKRDLENLYSEMAKLENFVAQLSRDIANYNKCGYNGATATPNKATVDTSELDRYLHRTQEVVSAIANFRYVFEKDCAQIKSELTAGIEQLERNRSQCNGALSSLKEKISRANVRLEECKAKLQSLLNKLNDLEAKLREVTGKAREARAKADSVKIPPYKKVELPSGEVKDNRKEIENAKRTKQSYLNEAERYEREAAELRSEISSVKSDIQAVKERINYIQNLLSQMKSTESQLKSHISSVDSARGSLLSCRDSVASAESDCNMACHEMSNNCMSTEGTLRQARAHLNEYECTTLNAPSLRRWGLF